LGNDFIDGGNGYDYIVVYEKANNVVRISNDDQTGVNSSILFSTGEIDTYKNIEGIVTTQYDDLNLCPWVNNCTIYSREGNDVFNYTSYTGCKLYGEAGLQDKIDYTIAPALATVYLNETYATIQGIKTDYLYNIEYVTGTAFNDVIVGDAQYNYIKGLEGDD